MQFSVHDGNDSEILNILIKLHSRTQQKRILDSTYNTGKMWKGLAYKPLRMDINKEMLVDVVGDFTNMPFADHSFDIIVFDPPHLPTHAASINSSKIYESRYGITDKGEGREGDNVSPMFSPFLKEAKRVLSKNGIILCKIADLVHNHRYQWQHVDFINAVNIVGMTPCDCMIKIRKNALISSKWQTMTHLRKCHTYWIVVRNSEKCE